MPIPDDWQALAAARDPRRALRQHLAFLALTPRHAKQLDSLVRHCKRVVVSDGGIDAYLAGNRLDGVLSLSTPADWTEAPWKSLRRHLTPSVIELMNRHERITIDMSAGLDPETIPASEWLGKAAGRKSLVMVVRDGADVYVVDPKSKPDAKSTKLRFIDHELGRLGAKRIDLMTALLDTLAAHAAEAVARGVKARIVKRELGPTFDSLECTRLHYDRSSLTLDTLSIAPIAALHTPAERMATRELVAQGALVSTRGVAAFRELRTLCLTNDPIADLADLDKLKHLEVLELANYVVRDVTPIFRLAKLRELQLSNGPLVSIAGIERLTRLEKLDVGGTEITSMAPIARLRNLRELRIQENRALRRLEGLDKLPELERVDFFDQWGPGGNYFTEVTRATKRKLSELCSDDARRYLDSLSVVS